ncbi:MAG: hypothetical protein KatS3mg019_1466 [Fimbriimonadales bacterium]|nr:MAG: hypothetical protein KatS3mg019_1466 [Fimbriimonadales bacterium]
MTIAIKHAGGGASPRRGCGVIVGVLKGRCRLSKTPTGRRVAPSNSKKANWLCSLQPYIGTFDSKMRNTVLL